MSRPGTHGASGAWGLGVVGAGAAAQVGLSGNLPGSEGMGPSWGSGAALAGSPGWWCGSGYQLALLLAWASRSAVPTPWQLEWVLPGSWNLKSCGVAAPECAGQRHVASRPPTGAVLCSGGASPGICWPTACGFLEPPLGPGGGQCVSLSPPSLTSSPEGHLLLLLSTHLPPGSQETPGLVPRPLPSPRPLLGSPWAPCGPPVSGCPAQCTRLGPGFWYGAGAGRCWASRSRAPPGTAPSPWPTRRAPRRPELHWPGTLRHGWWSRPRGGVHAGPQLSARGCIPAGGQV